MENKQEIDLIELLLLFFKKIKKNKYFFLFIVAGFVMLGVLLNFIRHKSYTVELLTESFLKKEILYKLVDDINIQNNKTYFLSPKVENIHFTQSLEDFKDTKEKEGLLSMTITLNDTTQFSEVQCKITNAITEVPIVVELLKQKRKEINKTIEYYSSEIAKIEKFQNSILKQYDNNSVRINSNLMSSVLVDMKIKKSKLNNKLKTLSLFRFVPTSFVGFVPIDSSIKDIFLFFLFGFLIASLFIIIKKN